jgi:hypothetical protein
VKSHGQSVVFPHHRSVFDFQAGPVLDDLVAMQEMGDQVKKYDNTIV